MSVYVVSEWGAAEWGISEWNRAAYLNDQITLYWDASPSPDVDYYTVRYAPSAYATWESAVEIYRTPSYLLTQTEELQCKLDDAANGSYLVAATDTSGNEGPAARVVYGEVTGEWQFEKKLIGHPDWSGETYEMKPTSDGFLLLWNRGPNLETYPDGFIYGWYQYAEEYNTGGVRKDVRFVVDRLLLEKADVRANCQWRNVQGGQSEWQDFTDTAVSVEGVVEFRIEVRNYTLDEYAGIREAEIDIYTRTI